MTRTAAAATLANLDAAEEMIARLQAQLAAARAEVETGKVHWGHAGDAAHIAGKLGDLVAFSEELDANPVTGESH